MAALVPVFGGNVGGPHGFHRDHASPTTYTELDKEFDVCESLNCNGLRMNYPYGPSGWSDTDRELIVGAGGWANAVASRWLNRGNHLMISLLEQPIGRDQNVTFRSRFTTTEWDNAKAYNTTTGDPNDGSDGVAYVVLTMASILAAPDNTAGTHSAQKARLCLLNNIIGQDLRNAYPTGTIGQVFNGPEQWEDFNWSPRHQKLRKFITDSTNGVFPNRGLGWALDASGQSGITNMPETVLLNFLHEASDKWGQGEPMLGNALHTYVHRNARTSLILRGWRDSPCVTECGVHRGYPSTGDADEESEFSNDYSLRAPVWEQMMRHLIDASTAPSFAASRCVEALQIYFFSIIHPAITGQVWRAANGSQVWKAWDPVLYRALVGETDWAKKLFHTYNAVPMLPDEPALREAVINVGQYFKLKHYGNVSKTDTHENSILNHQFRKNPTYTAPNSWWIGLYKKAPGEAGGGTELTGIGGYNRKEVVNNASNWLQSTSGETWNINQIAFGPATANWGRVYAIGLFENNITVSPRYYGLAKVSAEVPAGDRYVIQPTKLVIKEK